LTTPHVANRRVVGGNLSVLYAMLGTPFFPPVAGRWLLLEDLDEYLYHLDRMLVALAQGGVFDAVEGVMVGSFTDLKDNTKAFGQAVDNPFGRTVREMIEEHVVARGCRVEWDVPSGHGPRNAPLVLG
jgi:muramoyltetrapeptide carboxypeptidase